MWKSDSVVKYISRSGRESTRTICVTAEGFAIIMENGEELLFSGNGKPVNATYSPETGGPRIKLIKEPNNTKYTNIEQEAKLSNYSKTKHKLKNKTKEQPNYKTATINEPWDNIFALKNLNISELHKMLATLIELGYGNEKLHLKNFGKSANIENKDIIRQIFLDSKKS